MNIVFLDTDVLEGTSLEPVASLGRLSSWRSSSKEESYDRVADAEVLIVNKFRVDIDVLDRAPKLRLICEAATGVDNIDVQAAAERGIEVRNVAGYSTASVAQLAFAQVLGLTIDTAYYDDTVKSGRYSRSGLFTDTSRPWRELCGKTMGIIGLGAIGGRVARIAEAFGMKVIYYSASGRCRNDSYPRVSLESLLTASDVVSIHCPLNDATRKLIGKRQLDMMKRDAVLINMARGQVVDEQALADAISSCRIAGAAVDVYSEEPLPLDHPYLHTLHPERLRLTPHIAWTSCEAMERLVEGIAANISDFYG